VSILAAGQTCLLADNLMRVQLMSSPGRLSLKPSRRSGSYWVLMCRTLSTTWSSIGTEQPKYVTTTVTIHLKEACTTTTVSTRLPGFPLDYIALGIAWKCNTTALRKDLMDMYGEEGNERDRNLAQAIIGCILAMKGEGWDTSDSGSVEEFREKTRDVLQNSPRSC
jgi:hypothetical protein